MCGKDMNFGSIQPWIKIKIRLSVGDLVLKMIPSDPLFCLVKK